MFVDLLFTEGPLHHGPPVLWLLPKASNETVRDRLSFGMYLQFLCFLPFPKDLRIQLPLKT